MFFKKKKKQNQSENAYTPQVDITQAMLDKLESEKGIRVMETTRNKAYLSLEKDANADVYDEVHVGNNRKADAPHVDSVTVQLVSAPSTAGRNYHALTMNAPVVLRHMPLKGVYPNVVVFNGDTTDAAAVVSYLPYDAAESLIAAFGEGFVLNGAVTEIVKNPLRPKSFYDEAAARDGMPPFTDAQYEKICAAHKDGEYKEVHIGLIRN